MPTDAQRRNLASAHHAEVQKLNKRIALLESVLRQAREAQKRVIQWDAQRKYIVPYLVRDPIHSAIASIDAAISSTQEQT